MMRAISHKHRFAALAAVMAGLIACLALPPAAGAKAKKKGGGAFEATKVVNAPVPDELAPSGAGTDGILRSTVQAGKEFRGREIRDVEVTFQTLGASPRTAPPFTGNTEAVDIRARLDAPNGAHTTVYAGGLSNLNPMTNALAPFPSIGPLTLDDEARLGLGIFNPHSPRELYAPYIGRARPGGAPLAVMDGGPVRGTWTLTVMDVLNTGISNLVSWQLKVIAGRPFETK
jgi:hypothetical protein